MKRKENSATFFITGAFLGSIMTVLLFGFLSALPRAAPGYQVGWIGSQIYVQDDAGDVQSLWGGCLVEEDMYILDEVCDECVDIIEGAEEETIEVAF